MIHKILKKMTPVLQALMWRFLARDRNFSYKGIHILVKSGVFYPRFVFSTKILLGLLNKRNLEGVRFLELGAGSGIISLLAARKGAIVTASDINPLAVENICLNAERNKLNVNIIQSDLFTNIPDKEFELIIITPPYYPKDPSNYTEMAWYCGKDFEYFKKLFPQLDDIYKPSTEILMILSEDCRIDTIREIATRAGLSFKLIYKEKRIGEWNFVFMIEKNAKVS